MGQSIFPNNTWILKDRWCGIRWILIFGVVIRWLLSRFHQRTILIFWFTRSVKAADTFFYEKQETSGARNLVNPNSMVQLGLKKSVQWLGFSYFFISSTDGLDLFSNRYRYLSLSWNAIQQRRRSVSMHKTWPNYLNVFPFITSCKVWILGPNTLRLTSDLLFSIKICALANRVEGSGLLDHTVHIHNDLSIREARRKTNPTAVGQNANHGALSILNEVNSLSW